MPGNRVLIVDDAFELGRLLQAALGTLDPDLRVTVVPSAEEAKTEATRHTVDLLVTDIHLPGVSGLELARWMRTNHKESKIIVITGLQDLTMRQRSLDAGANYFFRKPLSMPDFLEVVRQLMETVKPKLPPPPVAETLPNPQTDRIGEALVALHRALGAYAVALLDDQGHILARDGEFSGRDLDAGLFPALMNTLTAGEKVSRFLGIKTPEAVFTFKGRVFELVISPLGGAFALLVVQKSGRSTIRLAIAVEEVLNASRDLEYILADMGLSLRPQPINLETGSVITEKEQAPASIPASPDVEKTRRKPPAVLTTKPFPVTELEPQPSSPLVSVAPFAEVPPVVKPTEPKSQEKELESLLESLRNANLKSEEVDDFWEPAADQEGTSQVLLKDKLTYEQARQMGLAPGAAELLSGP